MDELAKMEAELSSKAKVADLTGQTVDLTQEPDTTPETPQEDVKEEVKEDVEQPSVDKETVETPETEEVKEEKQPEKAEKQDKKDNAKSREEERKNVTWQKIQKEREELETVRKAIVDEKLQIDDLVRSKVAEEKAKLDTLYSSNRPDMVRLDPDALRKLAKAEKEGGNEEFAQSLLKQAGDIEQSIAKAQEEERKHGESIAQHRRRVWMELELKNPELKDQESPLFKKATEFFKHKDPELSRFFQGNANGEYYSVELGKIALQAEQAETLKQENEKLKEKLLGYEKIASPGSSYSQSQKRTVDFGSLSTDRQFEYLERKAMAETN